MDATKLESKAKPMKKRTSPWTDEGRTTQEQLSSVRLVHEHFEEVFVVPHIKLLWRVNADI